MQDTSSNKERVWRLLRWTPLVITALTFGLIIPTMLQGGIKKVFAWYALQLVLPLVGLTFLIPLVIYVLVRRHMSRPVVITGSMLFASLLPAILLVAPVTYPASISSVQPSATVRLPANAPLKVFWGGDTKDVNQHVVVPDQRWAYDLGVEPYFTGSTALEDYGCYGVPVVAPIRGDVVSAHDGEPDMTPGEISTDPEAITGNHVAIKMETGTYLVIAHLKLDSVAVEVGEHIEEGQVIGQCGNSGHTSEPHIHIHHQREDPNIFPVNFAEGLPLYFRDHDGDPMPEGGMLIEGDAVTATGDRVLHIGE